MNSLLGEIQMTLNSTALGATTKTLDVLIAEKAAEIVAANENSTTGVGNTVFSSNTSLTIAGSGDAYFTTMAKFVPPVSGIYKFNFIMASSSGVYVMPVPYNHNIMNQETTQDFLNVAQLGSLYMNSVVGTGINFSTAPGWYANKLKDKSLSLYGVGTNINIILDCIKGIPVMLLATQSIYGTVCTSRTITYGNS